MTWRFLSPFRCAALQINCHDPNRGLVDRDREGIVLRCRRLDHTAPLAVGTRRRRSGGKPAPASAIPKARTEKITPIIIPKFAFSAESAEAAFERAQSRCARRAGSVEKGSTARARLYQPIVSGSIAAGGTL